MTPAAGAATGHRTATRNAPRPPRRISGPVGGRLAPPAGRLAPKPARRAPRPASRPRLSLVGPMVARVRALPDNSLVDRLVRGRAWIPVLGVMLAGIVAMQVEILKLGSSMGRWIERSSTLTARNEQLRATVAGLADDQRIESMAAGMGMVMPPASSLGFLSVRDGSPADRIVRLHAPDPVQFLASLPQVTSPLISGVPAATTGLLSSAAATQSAQSTSSGQPNSTAAAGSQPAASASGGGSGPASSATGQSAAGSAGSSTAQVGAGGTTGTSGGSQPQSPSSQTTSGAAAPGGAALAPPSAGGRSSGG